MMKYSPLLLLALTLLVQPARADGDAAQGEQVFKKCGACHTVADKTNKVGPSLLGVVGRKVASVPDYSYSDSMKEYGATGAIWDEKTLDTYLTDPKAVVGKTKMAFPGLKAQADRDNLIAFLKTKM
jgi:cytochrome c